MTLTKSLTVIIALICFCLNAFAESGYTVGTEPYLKSDTEKDIHRYPNQEILCYVSLNAGLSQAPETLLINKMRLSKDGDTIRGQLNDSSGRFIISYGLGYRLTLQGGNVLASVNFAFQDGAYSNSSVIIPTDGPQNLSFNDRRGLQNYDIYIDSKYIDSVGLRCLSATEDNIQKFSEKEIEQFPGHNIDNEQLFVNPAFTDRLRLNFVD
ncbi:MAG: hypothetical protein HOE90_17750 [Bacteriovoracaceae bacterium]|jgi:hypothetical protein|nr:hypothetical protein [Bacteriovoracaceae bacterium]